MTHRILALLLAAAALAGGARSGQAFSTDPYIGAVELVGFGYCPEGSMQADGRLLSTGRYAALYTLLGTRFGGDKSSGTFALPDLKDQAPAGTRYCVVVEGDYPARP